MAKVKELEEKVRDLLEGKQEQLPASPARLRTYGLPLVYCLLTAALVLIPAAYWAGGKLKKTEQRIDRTERNVYKEIDSMKSKIPDEEMIKKIIEPYVLKEKDIETGVKKGIFAVIEEFGDDPSTLLIAIMQAQKLKKEREKAEKEKTSFNIDLDVCSREGFFEKNQLFVIWEKSEIEKLISFFVPAP